MASLLTKVHRTVRRRLPALSVRRGYDRELGGFHYEVLASRDVRRLEHLGICDARQRDIVLQLCRDGGYIVDEVVEGRTWLCRPVEGTP